MVRCLFSFFLFSPRPLVFYQFEAPLMACYKWGGGWWGGGEGWCLCVVWEERSDRFPGITLQLELQPLLNSIAQFCWCLKQLCTCLIGSWFNCANVKLVRQKKYCAGRQLFPVSWHFNVCMEVKPGEACGLCSGMTYGVLFPPWRLCNFLGCAIRFKQALSVN